MISSRLSKAVLALVVAGAGAGAIAQQLIGEREGLALTAYQDGARVWTICRGHTEGVRPGLTATREECDRLFASDLGRFIDQVDGLVKVPLPDIRRAAVVSFCFNVGTGACARSTFLRKLNDGHGAAACDEIPKWIHVAGKDCRDPASHCRGIVTRRTEEAELCRM